MSNRNDLVLCTATLDIDPMTSTPKDFVDQLDAAASAGFAGVCQWELQAGALDAAGMTPAQMGTAFADHGLSIPVLEALLPFSATEADALETARRTFDRAKGLGAGIVPAVCLFPGEFETIEAAVERYGALCDVAEAQEIKVPIEFLPWSGIPDLATAWQIVDATDRPSGAIMIDTWHWHRQPGGPNTDLLAQIPPSFLPIVQICDAKSEPSEDLYNEALTDRRVPGDGVVDFDEFFTALYATGADPLLAPEVFNAELAAEGRGPMAAAIMAGCRQVLAPFV
jgi:sugar phosphate isomerase/epimerase